MSMNKRRTVSIIQARMGSSRLPGKILMPLAGKPSLERMVERVRRARGVDDVVVATTRQPSDDAVERWGAAAGVKIYRGSEDDVLSRVLEAARAFDAEVIVQLTGDCPLIDPDIISQLIDLYGRGGHDYVSNVLKRTYPRGWDTQVFSRDVLERVSAATSDPHDREHVSLYIYEHPEIFSLGGIEAPEALHGPDIRICVDTDDDYMVVRSLFDALYPKNHAFTAYDVMDHLKRNPGLLEVNRHVRQKPAREGEVR